MFAIIEQGSKQYKVSQGDVIKIELTEVSPEATAIELNKVLFFSDGKQVKIGAPYLEGAKVVAKFETTADDSVVKGVKLFPMHFRRRKASKKRIGHRQKYLQVIIDKIEC
jgi:large subunit ribosomal protein L21